MNKSLYNCSTFTWFISIDYSIILSKWLLQDLFNNPESVVFDAPRNRYIISNWGDGSIVQIDSNGTQSYFSTELQNKYKVAGLYILNDTLLAASGDTLNCDTTGTGLTGFNIKTGEIVFHIPIPGIGLPNDITSDNNGIIYLTDYWENKLYKIENHKASVFIRENLNYPNGIMYDKEQNRSFNIISCWCECTNIGSESSEYNSIRCS